MSPRTSPHPRARTPPSTPPYPPPPPRRLSPPLLLPHRRRDTLSTGTELTSANAAVGFVSEDQSFTILEDDLIKAYVDGLKKDDAPAAAAAADATGAPAAPAAGAPMDED